MKVVFHTIPHGLTAIPQKVKSLFKILCKCLSSEVTVKAVTELDNKATHCHTLVL
ncbi:hypothetical protein [Symbiopectobacterium sp. RP]|uniref:hypothetical protein n=1 Tax=Symbiopectobacterium sp. RP TaxID=3248553 RepID=UPI003D2C3CF3